MMIYSRTILSTYSPELLEGTLKRLPLQASRDIQFCNFIKVPDCPSIRFSVVDQLENGLGYFEITAYGNDRQAAEITYVCYEEKIEVLFKKILLVWDEYNALDVATANIIKAKKEAEHSLITNTAQSIRATQVDTIETQKPKQKGRYRLTPEDIKERKKKVKEVEKVKKENLLKTMKEICYELDIPERTFRYWRHENY